MVSNTSNSTTHYFYHLVSVQILAAHAQCFKSLQVTWWIKKIKNQKHVVRRKKQRNIFFFFFTFENVCIHSQHSLHQLLLIYPLLYFLLFLLSVSLLSPEEDESSKAFVCYCFLVFHLIGKYIFLDLFQRNQWLISRLLIFCDVLAQVIKQDNTGYTFECNNCCKT